MKSNNTVNLNGPLYDYSLEGASTKDDIPVVKGKVQIQVGKNPDETPIIVDIPVYASQTFGVGGNENPAYELFESIMNGDFTPIKESDEREIWLSTFGPIDVQYFADREDPNSVNRAMRVPSKAKISKNKKMNNQWKADMLITKVDIIEADEEKKLPIYAKITGYIVNSKNIKDGNKWVQEAQRLDMVTFFLYNEKGIEYFSTLPVSEDEPHFASVWGEFVSSTSTVIEKNAFGEDSVRTYYSVRWGLTGINSDPYEFPSEFTMTEEQYKELKGNLSQHITEVLEKAKESKEEAAPAFKF